MRQSQLFTKTRKESPADEQAKNAQLLIRAGYIHKEMAGVYSYLPLGLRVIEKIKAIVREEMEAIGGQELLMSSLQNKEIWEQTNRWDNKIVDIWFKSNLQTGGEVGFGWTHEEPIGEMMKNYILSYKNLPMFVYQFQTKLRNELRAKNGIMRGREFIMKDMYSFSLGEDGHNKFYQASIDAYNRVWDRLGIGQETLMTFAAGGAFTKFSHEFQTITDAGEDVIYINRAKNIAINQEVLNDEILQELNIKRNELEEVKTAEVGNIFNFGTQKAQDLGLFYKNENEENIPVWMGSYGIGISRLMGVLVEKFADDKGLVWPETIAPFSAHLVGLDLDDAETKQQADKVYEDLQAQGIEVLYDDRVEIRPGEKFADADLLGMPYRLVISKRTADQIEVKKRIEADSQIINLEAVLKILK